MMKNEGDRRQKLQLKEIIYHFPFVILALSLEESESHGFFQMTKLKLQMENDK